MSQCLYFQNYIQNYRNLFLELKDTVAEVGRDS